MKAIVIGCGKFGVRISEQLTRKNHEVVVVDKDVENFHALSEKFTGRTICGVVYDKDVLDNAGIATADAVICCTSSDSLNAVVSNIAKNVFHVPTVVASVYDPIRARMFESMGIYTVSITKLGLDNVMEYLEGNKSWSVIRSFGNDVRLVKVRIPVALVGTEFSDLTVEGKMTPVAVERQGRSMLPEKGMRCEFNDVLYLSVAADYLTRARDILQL